MSIEITPTSIDQAIGLLNDDKFKELIIETPFSNLRISKINDNFKVIVSLSDGTNIKESLTDRFDVIRRMSPYINNLNYNITFILCIHMQLPIEIIFLIHNVHPHMKVVFKRVCNDWYNIVWEPQIKMITYDVNLLHRCVQIDGRITRLLDNKVFSAIYEMDKKYDRNFVNTKFIIEKNMSQMPEDNFDRKIRDLSMYDDIIKLFTTKYNDQKKFCLCCVNGCIYHDVDAICLRIFHAKDYLGNEICNEIKNDCSFLNLIKVLINPHVKENNILIFSAVVNQITDLILTLNGTEAFIKILYTAHSYIKINYDNCHGHHKLLFILQRITDKIVIYSDIIKKYGYFL